MTLYRIIYGLIVVGFLLQACNKRGAPNEETAPMTGNPVESNPPNTNYKPAFTGQTRVGGVHTKNAIQTRIVTSALSSPWGIAALPDGRLLVTEKAGRMRIVTTNGTVGNALTGIPSVNNAGQGGLLGVCIDPSFVANQMLYWVFSENVTRGTITSVAKGRLAENESRVEGATVIYRSNNPHSGSLHYGSRIIFDQEGQLLVSIGERSDLAKRLRAQLVNSSLGKVIRINTNGQPASSNPPFLQVGALPELFTMGHRNPQGLAMHPVSKEIWLSEHGPRGGDEVNLLRAGANYGWPTITYGIEYSGQTIGLGLQQQDGLEQPVYYWVRWSLQVGCHFTRVIGYPNGNTISL